MQVRQSWLEIDMLFTSRSTQDNDLIKLQEDERGIVKRDGAASPKLHLRSRRTPGNGIDNPEAGESRKPTRWRTPAMQRHYADVNLTNSDLFGLRKAIACLAKCLKCSQWERVCVEVHRKTLQVHRNGFLIRINPERVNAWPKSCISPSCQVSGEALY